MEQKKWWEIRRNALQALFTVGGAVTIGSYLVDRRNETFDPLPPDRLMIPDLQLKNSTEPHQIILGPAPEHNQYPIYNNEGIDISPYFQIINLFFSQKDCGMPNKLLNLYTIAQRGQIPMISLTPDGNSVDNRFIFARDTAQYLDTVQSLAKFVAKIPSPVWIRYCYEMNGDWTHYSPEFNSPEDFIKGYIEVSDLFKSIAPNTVLVWSPNVGLPIEPFFPGDENFDIAGLDGYNKYRKNMHPASVHPDISFHDLFGPSVAKIQKLTQKHIMVAETNSARPGNFRINWFKKAIELSSQWKNVFMLAGFFWNKEEPFDLGVNETNWIPDWVSFKRMLDHNPHVQKPILK